MPPLYRGDRPARATRRLHLYIYNSFLFVFCFWWSHSVFVFCFFALFQICVFLFLCVLWWGVEGGVSHTLGGWLYLPFYIYIYFFPVILSEGHRTDGALQEFDRMNLKQCCRSFPAEQKKKKRRPNTFEVKLFQNFVSCLLVSVVCSFCAKMCGRCLLLLF